MNESIIGPLNPALLSTGMPQDALSSPLRKLTAGLMQGDNAAWLDFHRGYGPAIFRQLLGATRGDHDLATEALQQAYLRVARHARPCDSEPMFRGWLRTVARTALLDCRRRRFSFWRLLRSRLADPVADQPPADDDEPALAALDAALAQIDPEDRTLLEAKYFSGAKVEAIATRLHLSPKAVESRLTRARADLRRHLLAALPRHD